MQTPFYVDFYILENANKQQCLHFACSLIEKAYAQQEIMYVHTSSQEEAQRLDDLLWMYKDDSFVPHALYYDHTSDPASFSQYPIQIGFAGLPKSQFALLLNMDQQVPAFYKQCGRVIEIVFSDLTVQQLARERYRQYREQGCILNTHKTK